MHKILFFCIAVTIGLSAAAQKTKKERKEERRQRVNALIKQEEEGVIAYRKHNVYGFKLTNDGWGLTYEHGRAQSIKKALLFQVDFAERKDPKEKKQTNLSQPSSPFIFGKINYFYPLKLGVQQQLLLGNKSNKNGVAVTGNFGGGLSLGLLRPYYLEVNDSTGGRRVIKYDSPDSTIFTSPSQLGGLDVASAGFSKGWGDMKLSPGAYAKAALRFDYGRYNEVVSALEVGVTAEYYFSKVPQLIYTKQKQLFVNVYFAILFGRRR
ncbi:MAG: hypothetical protein IPP72_21845 [Chitinophagaceae bacterium]|nr:hypothetical protein [Chitinophagaceae bacterium]